MMNAYYPIILGGVDEAPVASDSWKRALYRPPPTNFSVELLSPTKQGHDYAFGMRICPIRPDNRSGSSGSSHSEYEIWRRWEDCLWFQDCIELEYERMSRAKKRRLAAGKGVKKNGIYKQDIASSFESLPPGPDPKSVTMNIHDYVPPLTKRATVFRTSQATIDQRYRELQACINGLFQENVPMLIQELRESRRVTDFFGYWRRDFDLALKQQKGRNLEKQSRNSISSSVFSTYFSSSNPNLSATDNTLVNPSSSHKSSRSKKPPATAPAKLSTKSSLHSASGDDFYRHRGSDSATTLSFGSPSPPGSPHGAPSPFIVPHDIPIVFAPHNPMESLPEDEELVTPGMADGRPNAPTRSTRKMEHSGHRNGQMFPLDANEENLSPDNSLNRQSWQTTTSTVSVDPAAYLADLHTDLTMPKSPTAATHFPRGSVSSFASFMTDSSADAIIPLSLQSPSGRSFSSESTRTRTLSDTESTLSDAEEDLAESYFDQAFGPPPSSAQDTRPESIVDELPSSAASVFSSHSSSDRSRGSLISRGGSTRSRGSMFSDFTSSDSSAVIGDGSISVKVVHNKAIILLRIPPSISYEEFRVKVYEKFVQQESVPLSASYAMAFLPPAPPIDYSKPRSRSNSVSSVGFPDLAHMRFISSPHDWEHAIASAHRGKLTLRAIGDQGV